MIKIHSIFEHKDKNYIHFSINNSKYSFLYFYSKNEPMKSLFYGEDFKFLIPKYLQQSPNLDCLECKLGTGIVKGIFFDHRDTLENNLNLLEDNKILKKLKKILEVKYGKGRGV